MSIDTLFSPFQLKNHTLKNRIAAGALHKGATTFSLLKIGSDLLEIINEKK